MTDAEAYGGQDRARERRSLDAYGRPPMRGLAKLLWSEGALRLSGP